MAYIGYDDRDDDVDDGGGGADDVQYDGGGGGADDVQHDDGGGDDDGDVDDGDADENDDDDDDDGDHNDNDGQHHQHQTNDADWCVERVMDLDNVDDIGVHDGAEMSPAMTMIQDPAHHDDSDGVGKADEVFFVVDTLWWFHRL